MGIVVSIVVKLFFFQGLGRGEGGSKKCGKNVNMQNSDTEVNLFFFDFFPMVFS